MKIYQPLQVKDAETGLWFKEWEIPEGMPIPDGMVLVAPSDSLLFPRWDNVQGVWIEDKDSIIEKMKKDNDALKTKTDSMAQLNSKLMMNDLTMTKEIEALKAQLNPVENVETEPSEEPNEETEPDEETETKTEVE